MTTMVRFYTADGVEAWIATTDDPADVYADVAAFTAKATAAGFRLAPPEGVKDAVRRTITHVARREKGDDGTPIMDMYGYDPDRGNQTLNFKIFSRYLNNDAEIAEWAAVTGMAHTAIPLYESKSALEFGDNLFTKYGRALAVPAKIVLRHNPAYNPDAELKERKAQFLWVQFDGVTPPPRSAPQAATGGAENGTFTCAEVETKVAKNGNMYYVAHEIGGDARASSWSRDVFAPLIRLSNKVQDDLAEVGTHHLPSDIIVHWELDKGYPKIVRIEVDSEPDDDIPF